MVAHVFMERTGQVKIQMMEYVSTNRFSQRLTSRQALLSEVAVQSQVLHDFREKGRAVDTAFPDNEVQLIRWIEDQPREFLEARPRLGLLYIHALLFTQQHERAKRYLYIIEQNLMRRDYSERESIQGEITTLHSYLAMHQELASRFQEIFHDMACFFMGPEATMPVEPLSKRELEVLECIAAGMSNQEIAVTIIVTVGTVKRHINNIYNKLNVHSRIQAVRYAQTHHLLPAM